MTNNDEKEIISFEEAEKLLPARGAVHTFRQVGFMMLGADHDRASLLDKMRAATEIQVTGPQAKAMRHGLAIIDDVGILFIETENRHD